MTAAELSKFHGRELSEFSSKDMEWDLFVRESTAYRVLKEKGLCDRGVVPDFYGTITNIHPTRWTQLHHFHEDELPSNAVLIEYIPNMHQVDLSNFSDETLRKISDILSEIHNLGILHGDTYPRNMMVAGNRVLWIDFDSAQMLSPKNITRWDLWLGRETGLMREFVNCLVCLEIALFLQCLTVIQTKDHQEGSMKHAWNYYYQYD